MSATAGLALLGLGAVGLVALSVSKARKTEGHFQEDIFGNERRFRDESVAQLMASTLAAFTYDVADGNDPVTGEGFEGILLTHEAQEGEPVAADWISQMLGAGFTIVADQSLVIPSPQSVPLLYAMTESQAKRAATDPNSNMAIFLEPA